MNTAIVERVKALMEQSRYPWLGIAGEILDEEIAKALSNYTPATQPVLSLDILNTESKVFVLMDRLFARRNELLQLQAQAYTQALQYEYGVRGRAYVRSIIDASTRVEETALTAAAMRQAALAFSAASMRGFAEQSTGAAEADAVTSGKETTRRTAMHAQADLQDKYDEDLKALYTVTGGPFDYLGRYGKLKRLYLNDFFSFVDAAYNYVQGATFYGVTVDAFPDYKSPDFLWEAGRRLQEISRKLYDRRVRRSVRQVILSVGWTRANANARGDVPWKQATAPPGLPNADLAMDGSGGLGDILTSDDSHRRLHFWLGEQMIAAKGIRFAGATDIRIEAVGIEWIVVTPIFGESSSDGGPNRAIEYKMRNFRGMTVPTVLWAPPAELPGLGAADLFFPNATTTDEGVERVLVSTDPMVVGRSPFGHWMVDVRKPQRRGKDIDWSYSGASTPEFPNVCGLRLHLTLSAILGPAGA
jgi:hypothetical protein